MLLVGVVQWQGFLVDYYGDYRVRSAPLFQGNIESAIQEIIDRESASSRSAVYVAKGLDLWWKFYAIKHHRGDLLDRVNFVEPPDLDEVPRGAFVLLSVQTTQGQADAMALVNAGAMTIKDVHDLDGAHSFAVLQR